MRDLVLVPSYFRPEFLALVLEHILAADGGRQKEVWVAQDRHINDGPELTRHLPDIKLICEKFRWQFEAFRYIERPPHGFRGNPLNFLELYKEAFHQDDCRYVYLVEDDVLVGKDFFRWHEAVQEKEAPFISVGWHCIRDTAKVPATEDPHAYVVSYRDFSSIGVCWKRENLDVLVRHATGFYYIDNKAYFLKHFPGSPIPAGKWTEQAGLITRLLHQTRDRKVIWPGKSRVAHIGIQGYHRPNGFRFPGELQQRINGLKDVVSSTEKMQALSKDKWLDVNALPPYEDWDPAKLYVMQTNLYDGTV